LSVNTISDEVKMLFSKQAGKCLSEEGIFCVVGFFIMRKAIRH
jgi:hypothetical protein